MAAQTPDRELLWRQYSLQVELYKFYLDLVIKLNIFHYAVTGAVLSFYFSRPQETALLKYSLILPAVMSAAFGAVFVYAAQLLGITREEVFNIRDKLEFESAPEFQVLTLGLRVFAILFFLITIGLVVLMWVR